MINLLHYLRPSSCNYRLKGEELICVRFTAYMREMTLTGRCKYVWFHVSNEGSAAGKQIWGARQRNMGKFAGVADYIFLGNTNLALEMKDGKKPLQPSQKDFQSWCKSCEVHFKTAHSLEEAVEIVESMKITLP